MSNVDDYMYQRRMRTKPISKELNHLRKKIMDAIVFSESFWLMYKQHTFGMAGFLDLNYKKSYIEILFFTPQQAKRRNGRVLQINSPLLRELNFRKIFEKPDIDSDGYVNPLEILKRIQDMVKNEIQAYLFILDNQVRKLNEEYENYPVNNNPYIRKIFIYFEHLKFSFTIDFQIFPKRPKLRFSDRLNKVLDEKEFLKKSVMKDWSEDTPFSIPYIIDELMNEIVRKIDKIKDQAWNSDTQQLIFNRAVINNDIPEISLRIHRGETMGIIYNQESTKKERENITQIYRTIAGTQQPYSGNIKFFGKNVSSDPNNPDSGVFIVSSTIEPRLENKKLGKAISKNIRITTSLEDISWKRKIVDEVLEISALNNKKDIIVSNLSVIDRIKFSIGRALLQSPQIIMFDIPQGSLERLEMAQFNSYLKRVTSRFHTILIVHGPKQIVANCDKILNIAQDKANSGSIDDLVLQIPQSGEVIIIELNNINPDALNKNILSSILEDAVIIEVRENEKFKIFSRENPDELIIRLMRMIGPFMYNFKRFKPSLAEYLEFTEATTT
ncbi:MAG: hypothetical protein GF364_04865 [Candidatus Lokiarchaeota archaeon]|nr:hypothetical protein [Candidatus Lokiarchaeota archaeon]